MKPHCPWENGRLTICIGTTFVGCAPVSLDIQRWRRFQAGIPIVPGGGMIGSSPMTASLNCCRSTGSPVVEGWGERPALFLEQLFRQLQMLRTFRVLAFGRHIEQLQFRSVLVVRFLGQALHHMMTIDQPFLIK